MLPRPIANERPSAVPVAVLASMFHGRAPGALGHKCQFLDMRTKSGVRNEIGEALHAPLTENVFSGFEEATNKGVEGCRLQAAGRAAEGQDVGVTENRHGVKRIEPRPSGQVSGFQDHCHDLSGKVLDGSHGRRG